ncbi:magnesium transporter [Thioalkalivibrio sp. ALE16]|uniref:magnesium transporter n=1 Tax=Thioalkalivibrio sp. ALE16 TaxID=1158172 RepID=UPI00036031E7|nr:magnesium transporter [Thioalkalivibrio sp. ALE16]
MSATEPDLETLPQVIADALDEPEADVLQAICGSYAAPDLSDALETLPAEQMEAFFQRLDVECTADIYAHLEPDHQSRVFQALDDAHASRLVAALSYDDAVSVIDGLEDDQAESLLETLPDDDQEALETLLGYPEESAGRLMTPEFATVQPDWSVAEAMDHLREHSDLAETVNTIFVITPNGELLGWVRLKELLLSRPSTSVRERMHTDVVSIAAEEDREEAAHRISHYDLDVLPVVDDDGHLLGIITVDDVMDVLRAETTEDFHRMAAVGDVVLSLRDASMQLLYRKRIGWLVILVAVNILSGMAIAHFEAAIETVVALIFFLPMVIATGGNAGAQASTLVVRSLATNDIKLQDWWRLGGKEILVSSALGATLAGAIWLSGNWLGSLEVANAIALGMFLVVLFGSMFGLLLPFTLTRFGVDPAVASAPLITSVVDVVGITIYFATAVAILGL